MIVYMIDSIEKLRLLHNCECRHLRCFQESDKLKESEPLTAGRDVPATRVWVQDTSREREPLKKVGPQNVSFVVTAGASMHIVSHFWILYCFVSLLSQNSTKLFRTHPRNMLAGLGCREKKSATLCCLWGQIFLHGQTEPVSLRLILVCPFGLSLKKSRSVILSNEFNIVFWCISKNSIT